MTEPKHHPDCSDPEATFLMRMQLEQAEAPKKPKFCCTPGCCFTAPHRSTCRGPDGSYVSGARATVERCPCWNCSPAAALIESSQQFGDARAKWADRAERFLHAMVLRSRPELSGLDMDVITEAERVEVELRSRGNTD
jgi:hypothetical protein